MYGTSISVEARFIQAAFNCSVEDLNYLISLIEKFESEYKYDIVNELVAMIIDNKSIDLECYTIDSLIYFTITKFAAQYLTYKCNFLDTENDDFFEFICDILGDIDFKNLGSKLELDSKGYRHNFPIDLGFWDEFVEAMNVFTQKMGKKEKEE